MIESRMHPKRRRRARILGSEYTTTRSQLHCNLRLRAICLKLDIEVDWTGHTQLLLPVLRQDLLTTPAGTTAGPVARPAWLHLGFVGYLAEQRIRAALLGSPTRYCITGKTR